MLKFMEVIQHATTSRYRAPLAAKNTITEYKNTNTEYKELDKHKEGGQGHLRGEATGVDPLSCQLTCTRSCTQIHKYKKSNKSRQSQIYSKKWTRYCTKIQKYETNKDQNIH